MNGLYYFGRRFVSAVALAMLVLAGWPQAGHAQPAGIEPQAEKLLRRMAFFFAMISGGAKHAYGPMHKLFNRWERRHEEADRICEAITYGCASMR
jgi:hypothetical protein